MGKSGKPPVVMEWRRRIVLATAALLTALCLSFIVAASLGMLYWFWAVLSIAALLLYLTATMRRQFMVPAAGATVFGLILAFTIGALWFPPTEPVEVQSHKLEVDDSRYRVVGTIEVQTDCVSWAGVRVTFYGPRYKVSGSTHVKSETGYHYFARMYEGDNREFCVEFSGAFELHRYRVSVTSGGERWCEAYGNVGSEETNA